MEIATDGLNGAFPMNPQLASTDAVVPSSAGETLMDVDSVYMLMTDISMLTPREGRSLPSKPSPVPGRLDETGFAPAEVAGMALALGLLAGSLLAGRLVARMSPMAVSFAEV